MSKTRLLGKKLALLATAAFFGATIQTVNTTASAAPAGTPGYIATQHPLKGADLLPGAKKGWYVHYQTAGQNNEAVWADGAIYEPRTPAPASGYKVVTYGHGFKGIAPHCQPAVAHTYNKEKEFHTVTELLKKGYVVALTDFPIVHHVQPFLAAHSLGASILDVVRAARRLDPNISRDILIGGYSMGGQGAFSAANMVSSYAPELVNHGLYSLSSPYGQQALIDGMGPNSKIDQLGLSVAIGLVLAGFRAAEPQYAPLAAKYLTPKGIEVVNAGIHKCMDGWVVGPALTKPKDLFRRSVKGNDELRAALTQYIATPTTGINVPVFLTQGTKDPIIKRGMTEGLRHSLASNGTPVGVRYYNGADHATITTVASADIVRFVLKNLSPR